MNLRQIIKGILANKQGEYMKKPEIVKQVYSFSNQLGRYYTAESVGRELRRMAQKGIIEKNKSQFYVRYKL